MVYDHKQTDRHTHVSLKCSPASVGLTQARPNQASHLGSMPTPENKPTST